MAGLCTQKMDLQIPTGWPQWLISAIVPIVRPFAVTDEWVARRPWETIQQATDRCLADLSRTELYLGLSYLLSGAPPRAQG